jgi:hypothetical protein
VHDFLDVSKACACTDLLECVFNLIGSFHLAFHLFLKELGPHLLDHEVLLHLELIGVLVFIGSCLCNLVLSVYTIHPSLDSFLLVLDGFIQAFNPLFSMLLFLVDLVHQLLQFLLCLETLLFGLARLLSFLLHDDLLLLVGVT